MLSLLKIARAFDTSLSALLDGMGKFPIESVPEIKKKQVAKKQVKVGTKKTT